MITNVLIWLFQAESLPAPTNEEEACSAENAVSDLDHDEPREEVEKANDGDADSAEVLKTDTDEQADDVQDEPAASDEVVVDSSKPETKTVTEKDSTKPADADGTTPVADTFVVHIDESDTNLDYDLTVDNKGEERDAPTPTKDESMDVDAADIVHSDGTGAVKQTEQGATDSGSTSGQASKRLVSSSC